jgi:hypothetical protein
MENRKVHVAPVPRDQPVKVKPGDFEPQANTKEPMITDPPSGGQCPTDSSDTAGPQSTPQS